MRRLHRLTSQRCSRARRRGPKRCSMRLPPSGSAIACRRTSSQARLRRAGTQRRQTRRLPAADHRLPPRGRSGCLHSRRPCTYCGPLSTLSRCAGAAGLMLQRRSRLVCVVLTCHALRWFPAALLLCRHFSWHRSAATFGCTYGPAPVQVGPILVEAVVPVLGPGPAQHAAGLLLGADHAGRLRRSGPPLRGPLMHPCARSLSRRLLLRPGRSAL